MRIKIIFYTKQAIIYWLDQKKIRSIEIKYPYDCFADIFIAQKLQAGLLLSPD